MGLCGSSAEEVVNPDQVDASHFQFAKVVGKGGFGKVNAAMRAEDPTQLVAIKRIAKRRVLNPGLRESVWTERDVMSRVQSPFTLKLHHSFQDNDELYLVMPFFRGGDLDYYMEVHGPLDEDKARFYAAEIVLGMEELHSLNILYRDLKPQNCLLQDTGHLAISDYGLCVVLKEETGWKAKGTSGTTGFQAPEVLSGGYYSYSADFFSFGVTLYVLLTRYYRMFGKSGDQFNRTIDFSTMSERAADLIQQLLITDPEKRLGCGKVSAKEMEARILAEEERLAAIGERKTGTGGVLLEGKGDGRLGSDSITTATPRIHDNDETATSTGGTATTLTPNAVTLTFPLLSADGTASKRRSVEKKTASDDTHPIELAPKENDHSSSAVAVTIVPTTTSTTTPAIVAADTEQKKDADGSAVAPSTVTPSSSTDNVSSAAAAAAAAISAPAEKKLKPSAVETSNVAAAAATTAAPTPLAQTPRRPSVLSGYQMLTGWAAVKAHPFFDGIDWNALKAQSMTPPYIPQLKENQAHCSNRHSLVEHFELDKVEEKPLTAEQQSLFVGFEFNTKLAAREQWAEYTPADEKKRKKAADDKAKKDKQAAAKAK